MNARRDYVPGPAHLARIHKEGEHWTLIVERELRHPPELVWEALTDPEHLAEWAPFDADRNLGAAGPVMLATAGQARAPAAGLVRRADAPRLLEYDWGGQTLRWELEPTATGTRLTLWHDIDRRFIAWGAAGWHVCFDVLDRLLARDPIGRLVGALATQFSGWQRLAAEYAQQFEDPNSLAKNPL